MDEDREHYETINTITAGRIDAQMMERHLARGTATSDDLIECLQRIRSAFDRLADICGRTKHQSIET